MLQRFHVDGHLSEQNQALQTAMLELVRGKLAQVAVWCSLSRGGDSDTTTPPARTPDSAQMIWPLRWILPAALRKRALGGGEHMGWRDGADVQTAVSTVCKVLLHYVVPKLTLTNRCFCSILQ